MDDFFWQYNAVSTLVIIVFVIVGVFFVVMLARGIAGWHRNNNSPRLTVEATVVSLLEFSSAISLLVLWSRLRMDSSVVFCFRARERI